MKPSHRAAFAAFTAVLVTAVPASAATLHLKAPKEIDRADKFRLTASGKAKPQKAYYLSVLFQDDNQGRCERKLEKEVTTNKHGEVYYLRKVMTDQDGLFELSKKLVGGDKKTTGRFCGYLTNEDGTKNKDRAVRRIAFT
ncbi:MAG: hypothetical protein ACJ74X_09135 [Gaiellaceae bacterium]